MEVPRDAESVGWWRHGATPGHDGSAVLAGHVTWHGERGPFYAIGDLAPGSEIEVEFSDGTTATFQAVARSSYAKLDLPTARLFAQNTPPILHLVTCGGDYDGRSRSYEDNIVVTAVIADGSDAVSGARQ
jgi:sortase (surface protein transpeptidase)